MADSTITLRVVSEEVGSAPASSAHASSHPLSAPPSAPSAGSAKGVHTGFNAPAIPPQATRTAGAGAGGAGSDLALAGGARLQSLAGLALHQGFSALTGALGTIPGQKRTAGTLSAVGGGAIAGGLAGSAAGLPGIAIGATLGALVGSLSALASAAKETRDALNGIATNARNHTLSVGMSRQDRAFAMSLQTLTRDQREEAIAERANTLRRGEGELSIRSLEAKLSALAKAGKTDTEEYKHAQGDLSKQYSRLGTLQAMDDDLFFNRPTPKPLAQSDLSDRLSVMGGTVGASVNVGEVNRELVDLTRQMLRTLNSLANRAPNTLRGIESASGPFTAALATLR